MATSAIKTVRYYRAEAKEDGRCCDRCGQWIRNIAAVTYQDGEIQRYGLDCIEKILENVPTLKALYLKNLKLAAKYQEYIALLSGPVENMPRGSEYFNSGLYFIGDGNGKDIFFEHWFFHPAFDAEKNEAGGRYVVQDAAAHVVQCQKEIALSLTKLQKELDRTNGFLARALTKALMSEVVA